MDTISKRLQTPTEIDTAFAYVHVNLSLCPHLVACTMFKAGQSADKALHWL